jgi:membrane-associated phospholipid phosphatase
MDITNFQNEPTSLLVPSSFSTDTLANNFAPLNSLSAITPIQYLNQEILPIAQIALQHFATTSDFFDNIEKLAFGYGCNVELAHTIIENLGNGQLIPNIQIIPQSQLKADGAFGKNTIYLSSDLFNPQQPNSNQAVNVLLEEMGHYIDSQINIQDTPGDEGAIFAKLVQNQPFQTGELAALKAEDDQGLLNINGKNIAVEHADTPGVFIVDNIGKISIDFLADSGSYHNEMAIFSLQNMDNLTPGSVDYIKEAARRALSNSALGYTVIIDINEGAKFVGELGESNRNDGNYSGLKAFTFTPGDKIAFMLVPQGTVQQVFDNPNAGNNQRPLFSIAGANPNNATQIGQLLPGTFGWEDIRVDQGTDADYNDIIFKIQGATGILTDIGGLFAPGKDWRNVPLAKELITFASQDNNINLTAKLSQDTGISNLDGITNNSEISGSVNNADNISKLQAKFSDGNNFVDILSELKANGGFVLNKEKLAQIKGGQIADGNYQLNLRAEDKFGNISEFLVKFTLDTTKPGIPTEVGLKNDGDRVTNQNTPTITGNGENGALIELFDGQNKLGQTTVVNGFWEITTSQITDGLKKLTITATDISGNQSDASNTEFTIDSALPQINITNPQTNAVLNPGARLQGTVNGTGSTIDKLSYRFGNGSEINIPVNAQGAFDVELNLTDLSGQQNLIIKAVDLAGNSKETTQNVVVNQSTPDTTAPLITASLNNDTGINTDGITFDSTITGTVTDISEITTFQAKLNSGNFVDVLAKLQNGNFTLDTTTLTQINGGQLPDGTYQLTFKAEDKFGNVSSEVKLGFTLDTTKPAAATELKIKDDTDAVTKDNTPIISGQAETGTKVQIFDGQTKLGETTSENGVWEITTSQLTDGVKNLTVIITDIAGNVSDNASLSITVDTVVPDFNITNPQANGELTTGARLQGTVNGTGSTIDKLSYRFGNGSEINIPVNAQGAFDVELTLTDLSGQQNLIIKAVDLAGNSKETTQNVVVNQSTPDTTAPLITASLNNDTGINTDGITFDSTITGTVTDISEITTFQAKLNSGNFVDVLAKLQNGNFTLDTTTLTQINDGQLPDGVYQLNLKAEDKFGNVSSEAKLDFTLDTTAPQTPGFMLDSLFDSAPIGDSQTTFTNVKLIGQTETNATVTLQQTGTSITADAAGKFTFTDVPLILGDNSLTVNAKDAAGNTSTFTTIIKRVDQDNSDVVLDWNATLLNAVYEDKTAPPIASRNMAIAQTAVFDAINSITKTYKNYHFTGTAPTIVSAEAAAASAAYTVLVNLYPNQKTFFDTALTASLAKITDGEAETTGVTFGQTVANDILTLRSTDGFNTTVNYTPGTNPGDWQPTPPANASALLPQWGQVTPFGLTSGSQFRPAGEPALTSDQYTTEFNQVKDLGSINSTTRTADQTEVAKFWADGSGTFTPPGHWNQIAQNAAATKGNSLVDNARLFALLDISLADAGIAAWDAKYTENSWRPITAIQKADTDGNPNTTADTNWKPLITTPPFPSYISGHSTFSAAAATVLTTILGDNVSFSLNSLGTPGVNRTFTNFNAAANEAGISRIYGGIHFNADNVDGLATGKSVGNYVLQNLLTKDVQAPVIQASLTSDTGSSNTDKITNNPAISGTVTDENAIAVFRAKLDSGAFVDVLGTLQKVGFSLDSAKLKEINGNTDLSQGEHTLGLEATDSKGNVSAVLNYSFTLDSVSPIAAITSDLSNEPTSLDVTVSEVVSGEVFAQGSYSLKVVGGTNDGQSVVINALTKVSDTLVRLSLATPLTAGNYQLAIAPEVKDTAGNSLANLTLNFTATPPTLAFAPLNGEGMVSLTRDGVVRFGTKVKPETVTNEAFYLIANGKRLAGQVKVSSTNEFATFLTDEILPASTEVRMVVDGSKILSQNGVAIDADGDSLVGGIGTADFTTLPIVRIAGTDVWGYVYDSYNKNPDGTNKPLQGVEIRLDFLPDVKAVTDANGYFILKDVPAPEFFVYIDGSKAANAPAGTQYASLGKAFHSVPGQSTQLFMDGVPFNIYLPPMFASDVKALSTTENTDVGFGDASKALLQQALPNVDPSVWDEVKVMFAPGSAQNREGNAATQAMIVPVAPDRLPAPLPPGVDPKLVISIQAGGANGFNREAQGGSTTFDVPAPLQFPNLEGLQPGEKALFWSFDHVAGEWIVIGTGTVTEDGKVIKSDPGTGVLAPGWHFVNPGTPTDGPPPPPPCQDSQQVIDDVIDVMTTVDDCAKEIAGISKTIDAIFQAAKGFRNLVNNAIDLKKQIDEAQKEGKAITIGTVTSGVKLLNDTKLSTVSVIDSLKSQNPVGKALAISKCIESVLGTFESICGRLTEKEDSPCNTIVVRTVCLGLATARTLLAKVNGLISKAEDGLKSLGLELVCRTIDQLNTLIKTGTQLNSNKVQFLTFDSLVTTAELAPDDPLPDGVLELLTDIISQGQEVNMDFTSVEEFGAKFGDLETTNNNLINDSSLIYGEIAETPANSPYLIEYNNFQLRGKTNSQGQISSVLPGNTDYKISVYDVTNNLIGTITGKTALSGSATQIPKILYQSVTGLPDIDGEGLVDKAEKIIGTSSDKTDTDNDGINDFAEIQQGLDPLGGQGFPTGIISSLPLLGEAKGVVVEGSTTNSQTQTAYVATGSYGLAVVNASQFNNPTILGQLDLAGDATDVAVDANLKIAAVATNDEGLQLVDISDPMLPTLLRTIKIAANQAGFSVNQVEVADGIAYITAGTSLRAIDLLTGESLQSLTLPGSGTVRGLAREGTKLYAFSSDSDTFSVIDIAQAGAASVIGQLNVSIASSDVGVFAANEVAYLGGSGLSTIDVSNPANPTLISSADNFFTARNVTLNGSGLGLVSQEGLGVGLYSLSDPQNTNNFITSFDTPGFTYGVALASGIAYVADGSGGLQVINYLPFDNKGIAPTVTITSPLADLDPNQTGIQITEGASISIQANVTDDVQVRNVELLVNGQVVSNDLSFPFDLQAIALSNDPNGPVVNVQTRVTDTGGNTSLSNLLTFDLVPDTIAPVIESITPANGQTTLANLRRVTVHFSEALDKDNINAANFKLINSANQEIIAENIKLQEGDRTVQLTYQALPAETYQLIINASQITDRAGNQLGTQNVVNSFTLEPSQFIDVSQTGNIVPNLQGDDLSSLIDLPFAFTFYGKAYTQAGISSNGLVSFGGTNADFTNQPLNSAASDLANLPSLLPFWDDIETRSNEGDVATVFTETQGTLGSRKFIVQWHQVEAYPFGSETGDITFELILTEGSNAIQFNYFDVNFEGTTDDKHGKGRSATVGIWNSPSEFQQYSFNEARLRDGLSLVVTEEGITEV